MYYSESEFQREYIEEIQTLENNLVTDAEEIKFDTVEIFDDSAREVDANDNEGQNSNTNDNELYTFFLSNFFSFFKTEFCNKK